MRNYRAVRRRHVYEDSKDKKERVNYTYAIHEAFYDDDGYVGSITQDPAPWSAVPIRGKSGKILRRDHSLGDLFRNTLSRRLATTAG